MQEQAKKPGFGRFGVLEEDEEGRVMCHLCGRWFKGLGTHVSAGHRIQPMDYRDAFGLKHSHGLMSEKCREPFRQNGLRIAAAGKANPPCELEGWRAATATVQALTTNRAWRAQRYPDRTITIACEVCGKSRVVPGTQPGHYKTCGAQECTRELKRRRATKKGST